MYESMGRIKSGQNSWERAWGDLEFLANGPDPFPVLVSGPAVRTGRGKRDRGKETVVDNPPSGWGSVVLSAN